TGTTHEMGIAVSADNVVFKAEGSSSKSITSGYQKTKVGFTNSAIYNAISYRLYKGWDSCWPSHVMSYHWRPNGYNDVINTGFTHSVTHVDFGHTAAGSCVIDTPGTQIKKQSGTSLTFSTGISLNGVAKDVGGATLGVSTKSTWDYDGYVQYDITKNSL